MQLIRLHQDISRQFQAINQTLNHGEGKWSIAIQDIGDAATGTNKRFKIFA